MHGRGDRIKPPHLVRQQSPGGGEVQLNSNETNVGADPRCEIVLTVEGAAALHAKIIRRGIDRYYVRDMGSASGTLVNGRRIDRKARLRSGDKIAFGREEFFFVDTAGRFRRRDSSSVVIYVAGIFGLILCGVLAYLILRGTPPFN